MAPSRKTVLVILMGASIASIAVGTRAAGWLRGITAPAIAPLGDGGMWLTVRFKAQSHGRQLRDLSPEEVRALHDEVEYWRRRTNYWRSRSEEYARHLRSMRVFEKLYGGSFGPIGDLPCELIPARVVGMDSLPYGRTRMVTPGRTRGVREGARVTTFELLTNRSKAIQQRLWTINATSLVGRVIEAGAFTARLQLVIDRGFAMRGRLRRRLDPRKPRKILVSLRDAAVLQPLTDANNRPVDVNDVRGDGKEGLIVSDVPAGEQIMVGDELVTRNDDALMPMEVRVGEVVEVLENPKNPEFVTLRVRPYAQLDALREVYIVWPLSR